MTPLEYNTQSATQEVNSQGNVNMYVVLKVRQYLKARWLSWLERRPVTAEVESSSLFWVVSNELTMFSKLHMDMES